MTSPALTETELKGQYDSELRRAGLAAMERDKDACNYALHLIAVTDLYKGQPNGFRRIMAEIERRCGKTVGFATFEQWLAARDST